MMRFFRLGPLILVLLLDQSFAASDTFTTGPADSTSPQELNTSPSNSSYDEADGSDPSPSLTPPHQHTTGAESNTTMISRLTGKTSAFPSNGSSTAISNLSSASGVSSNFTNDDPNNGTNEQVDLPTDTHFTSPPLTRGIMVTKPAVHCTFTVLTSVEGNVSTVVNISSSNQTYWLQVKRRDGTLVTSGNVSYAEPFKILFNQIKPCHKYEVNITGCSSNQSDFSFNKSVSQGHSVSFLTDSQVSFKDKKWNLKQNMTITSNNSCQNNTLTFPEEPCNYTMNVHIPPVKPLLTYSNSSVPVFNWSNRESQCAENLFKVICTSDGKEITSKLNESVYLVPSKMYNCSGIYNYFDTISRSNYSAVYINCSWINSKTVKSNRISITWSLTPSETCSEIPHNKASGRCVSHDEKKISCDNRKCDFMGLIPFTNYICTINITNDKINYNLHQIVEKIQTKSSDPEFKDFNVNVQETSHNSFYVSCTNLTKDSGRWNGPVGTYMAELMINNKNVENQTRATCYFSFKDLHYHTTYQIRIDVINGDGKKTSCEKTTSTSYNNKAVVGFLVFLILVTSVALIFVLYKIFHIKNKRSTEDEEMLPRPTLLSVEPICADSLIEAYKSKIADDARLFLAEFQSIPRIFSNYTIKEAKRAENQSKNRYVDILPYDYNRVALSSGDSDYINCSFIEGFREPKKFIAAQGPKEETIDDFWRMIWEQKSSIIVMVTRCEEGNKPKCAEYWPSMSRETEIYEDFVVKIQAEEHCPDYIIRRLVLTNKREKATEREVNHIQFISWPDHGVPGNPSLLLKLRKRVNSFNNFFSGPIVVHCSAGVGRTGTYISIDAMIESLEAEGKVDIYGFVAKLRRQRCLMVQVEAQYILIHTALIEHNQFGDTEVSLAEYHSTLNSLRQKEGDTSFLEIEFEKLPILKNWRTTKTGSSDENKQKNRYTALVPYDYNRVLFRLDIECSQTSEDKDEYSSDEEEEESNEYINASFIDGYWCEKSLIAAQGPLPQTTAEFLLMLYQQQTKTLVMLTDLTENNQEYCCQYWGDEKKVFGEMEVEVKKTESFVTYVKRRLALQSTKKKSVLEVDQYQFLKWRSSELPENAHDLMEMLKAVKANGVYDNSKTNRSVPVVVHCNNGSSRTGIFCALWNLMDSASNEKLLDVFQVAKNLRKERPGMLETFEQYQFLYTSLEGAFPVLNGAVKASNNNLNDISEVVDETASLLPEPSVTNTADDEKKAEETVEPAKKEDAGDAAENCSSTLPPAEGDEVKVSVDATTNHVTVEL